MSDPFEATEGILRDTRLQGAHGGTIEAVQAAVDSRGFALVTSMHDGVQFAFTVGLYPAVPELLIAGTPWSVATAALALLAELAPTAGFEHGARYPGILGVDIWFRPILYSTPAFPMTLARQWHSHRDRGRSMFKLWQVVLADKHDRFPWDSGYDRAVNPQPLGMSEPGTERYERG